MLRKILLGLLLLGLAQLLVFRRRGGLRLLLLRLDRCLGLGMCACVRSALFVFARVSARLRPPPCVCVCVCV